MGFHKQQQIVQEEQKTKISEEGLYQLQEILQKIQTSPPDGHFSPHEELLLFNILQKGNIEISPEEYKYIQKKSKEWDTSIIRCEGLCKETVLISIRELPLEHDPYICDECSELLFKE